jgi:hypothetical protein
MLTLRPYGDLDWFDFLDLINEKTNQDLSEEQFFELLDELQMRNLDVKSEGAAFKLKAPAKLLLDKFTSKIESTSDSSCCAKWQEFSQIALKIINS